MEIESWIGSSTSRRLLTGHRIRHAWHRPSVNATDSSRANREQGACSAGDQRYALVVTRAANPTPPEPSAEGESFVERMGEQGERVHIPLGARCNNHCLFCMEDREARARVNGAMTAERVRWIIDQHRGVEEICFTSGEPTLHPDLPRFIRWCRESGIRQVSLMTNGRRFSYRPYAEVLFRAGLRRVYVSIHGHTASLHDGMTRAPGSFAQTVEGLRVIASASDRGVELHTSTVVTSRNVPAVLEIYEMLVATGVQQAVFNALQVQGGADRHFERLVPRYGRVRDAFDRLLASASDGGRRAFLVDVPPCVTEGLPERNRGFMEQRVHYEAVVAGVSPPGATACAGGDGVCSVTTRSLDEAFRVYGPSCEVCRYRKVCPGVYERYARAHGWAEFHPVGPTK